MAGFHIEKLVFESLPGVFVTALVYVPDGGAAPHPAVLVPCGHSANGKAHYQALCQRLARARLRRHLLGPGGPGRAQPVLGRVRRPQPLQPDLRRTRRARQPRLPRRHQPRAMGSVGRHARARLPADAAGGRSCAHQHHRHERRRVPGGDHRGARHAHPCRGAVLLHHRPADARRQPDLQGSRQRPRAGSLPDDRGRRRSRGAAAARSYPRPVFVAAAVLDFFPIEGTRSTFREIAAIYRRFGHADRIAHDRGLPRARFSVENQATAFAFLDRFNGMPAAAGAGADVRARRCAAPVHADGPGAARSSGRPIAARRDPRLLPRARGRPRADACTPPTSARGYPGDPRMALSPVSTARTPTERAIQWEAAGIVVSWTT